MSMKSSCALGASLAALLVSSTIASAQSMKVHGTFEASVTQQQAHLLGADGMVIVSQLAKGTTKSPGAPIDGAEMLLSENVVLDRGNGPEQGSVSYANDKGSVTDEIHGAVTTVMVDGQPHTTVSGTYKMISGTGIFAGGEGHGTYTVTFTSKTDYRGAYEGTLKLPKHEASR